MTKRILLFLSLTVVVLVGLSWIGFEAEAGGATPECALKHRLRQGDTLSEIAVYYGVSVSRLAQVNGIRNRDLIRAGRELCVPHRMPVMASQIDLVATYKFPSAEGDGSEDAPLGWTLGRGGVGGIRASYPLLSGEYIHTYRTAEEVESASLNARQPPRFLLARLANIEESPEQPYSYTLVVIGSAAPFLELQLGFSKPLDDILAAERLPPSAETINNCTHRPRLPVSALVDLERVEELKLHAELRTSDGNFIPIDISAIDYFDTMSEAEQDYDCIGFAVHPTRNPERDGYDAYMVLNKDGAGPPGPQWRIRCTRWSGNNWWSRWLQRWYRC